MKKTLLIVFLCFLSSGCTEFFSEPREEMIIGTFNIAWLGDGTGDNIKRTEYHYEKIARIIEALEADVLALQEIENEAALERILKYLPGYTCFISADKNEQQNVAFLVKESVTVQGKRILHETEVAADTTRKGLLISVRKGNLDMTLICVHLKSTSRYDDTPEKRMMSFALRERQAAALNRMADSLLSTSEKDIVILGDFNDNPLKKKHNLGPLSDNASFSFITKDLPSCKSPIWKSIDHMVCSAGMNARLMANSLFVYDLKSAVADKELDKISDHCPVTAGFLIPAVDND